MSETLTKSKNIRKALTILDYCNNNKIPYVLFKLSKFKNKKGEIEKKTEEIPYEWAKKEYDELMNKYNNERLKKPSAYNAMNINLRKGNLVVVDIDTKDKKEQQKIIEKYGKEFYTKSTTKKLPHIYFKRDENDHNVNSKLYDDKGVETADICYSNIFEFIDNKIHWKQPQYMRTFTHFNYVEKKPIKKNKKFKLKKTDNTHQNGEIEQIKEDLQLCITPEQKEIIDNISIKYISNYQSWLKIIWALYNQFNNYNICNYVSKKRY